MGTRGLTMVVDGGEYKVVQYGQWDHYPSANGWVVARFCLENLLTQKGKEFFRKQLKKLRLESDEELQEKLKSIGVTGEWMSLDKSAEFKRNWPSLNRDMGATVLQYIWDAKDIVPIKHDLEFASDSLFCEYAWLVNLDTDELECYCGFNEAPVPAGERFADFSLREKSGRAQYYPIKLCCKIKFCDLPGSKQLFVKIFEDMEEKEEKEKLEKEPERRIVDTISLDDINKCELEVVIEKDGHPNLMIRHLTGSSLLLDRNKLKMLYYALAEALGI